MEESLRETITFKDGSGVAQSVHNRKKWIGWWGDRYKTWMRSDNDETSFFDSREEAIAALQEGGYGDAKPDAILTSDRVIDGLLKDIHALPEASDKPVQRAALYVGDIPREKLVDAVVVVGKPAR